MAGLWAKSSRHLGEQMMRPQRAPAQYADWEEQREDEAEIQELIRQAIQRGEIRVVPSPGGAFKSSMSGSYSTRPTDFAP